MERSRAILDLGESNSREIKRQVEGEGMVEQVTSSKELQHLYDDSIAAVSDEEDNKIKIRTLSGFTLKEVKGDLFSASSSHSLCHCISRDFKLGKGIAKLFREKFGRIEELKNRGASIGGIAVLKDKERYIYNLVTKEKYSDKPTYESMRKSLEAMKSHALSNGVAQISMPMIGCGLDGLNWPEVRTLLKNVFQLEKIQVTVHHQEHGGASVKSEAGSSKQDQSQSIAEMFKMDSKQGIKRKKDDKPIIQSPKKTKDQTTSQNTPAVPSSTFQFPPYLLYSTLIPDTPHTTTDSLVETETHSQLPLVHTIGQVMIDFHLRGQTFCPVANVEMITKTKTCRLATIGEITKIVPSSFMTSLVLGDNKGMFKVNLVEQAAKYWYNKLERGLAVLITKMGVIKGGVGAVMQVRSVDQVVIVGKVVVVSLMGRVGKVGDGQDSENFQENIVEFNEANIDTIDQSIEEVKNSLEKQNVEDKSGRLLFTPPHHSSTRTFPIPASPSFIPFTPPDFLCPSPPRKDVLYPSPKVKQLLISAPSAPTAPQSGMSMPSPSPPPTPPPPRKDFLCPSPKDKQLLISPPSKDEQLLISTPSKDKQLLVSTPSKDEQLLISTPSKDEQLLVSTPSKDDGLNHLPKTSPRKGFEEDCGEENDKRSRSPLRIRLSDYCEVSSVGLCDTPTTLGRGSRPVKINRILFTKEREARKKKGRPVTVKLEDYKKLQDGNCLNDVIIDFYLNHLQYNLFTEQDKNRVHIFTTYWYSRLTSKPSPKEAWKDSFQRRYDRVERWTRDVNIFEKDFVVVPINENYHWYLCIICYPGMVGCQSVKDSAPCGVPARQRNRRKAKDMIKMWKTKMNKKPRKDESDERDEPLASEDEIEHEDDCTDVDMWQSKMVDWEWREALRRQDEERRSIEMDNQLWRLNEEQQRRLNEEQQRFLEASDVAAECEDWKEENSPVKQPCILVLDSLNGSKARQARLCATLRGFLDLEYSNKYSGLKREFSTRTIPGSAPKVPQQPNLIDCGLYLLHNVEMFFKKPIEDFTLPIIGLENWFPEKDIKKKRIEIASMIKSIQKVPDLFPNKINIEDRKIEDRIEEMKVESKQVASYDDLGSNKNVKTGIDESKAILKSLLYSEPTAYSLPCLQPVPNYTMSLKMLDKLGPKSLFDSHCHLDFILFKKLPHLELVSFEQFLSSFPLMKHSSLEGFITNFCSPRLWMEHLSSPNPLIYSLLSRAFVYYTIGCHPHFARELLVPRNYRMLEQLLDKAGPNCVAVGECGLDTSGKNTTRMADQVEVFKMQVKLAIRMRKPLVLHIRDAEEEAIRVLEEVKLPADWPIHRHCWNDTWKVCQVWLKKFPASVVGITNLVTRPTATDVHRVAQVLPLNRMVLETDAPYFLPRGGGEEGYLGHTGKFSLPVHVAHVAAQIAAIRGCEVEEVLRANRANIKRVYGVE